MSHHLSLPWLLHTLPFSRQLSPLFLTRHLSRTSLSLRSCQLTHLSHPPNLQSRLLQLHTTSPPTRHLSPAAARSQAVRRHVRHKQLRSYRRSLLPPLCLPLSCLERRIDLEHDDAARRVGDKPGLHLHNSTSRTTRGSSTVWTVPLLEGTAAFMRMLLARTLRRRQLTDGGLMPGGTLAIGRRWRRRRRPRREKTSTRLCPRS